MVIAEGLYTLLFRLLRIAAVVFLLVMIGIAAAQDRLLYFPASASAGEMLAATAWPGVRVWPPSGDMRGLIAEPAATDADAAFPGTVVVFHGNAGHAGDRGFYIEALAQHGRRGVGAEYPGYGARSGALGEASLVADAVDTITQVRRQFGGPIYLVGESLGAGVVSAAAAELTRRGELPDGLLLITPWDTLANVAAHHYPWLPVRWLLTDRYDSVANLKVYAGPVVVVLAAADRVVPARYGQALIDALPGRARRIVIDGADHNDWTGYVEPKWWRTVLQAITAGHP